MKNEVKINQPDVQFAVGNVSFVNFEQYKENAQEIAEFINQFELTDSNVKEAKNMLARSRKVVQALDKHRIEIKKAMLSPYDEFAAQITELKKIVDDADAKVRARIKAFENQEREEKKQKIMEVWEKRIVMYDLDEIPDLFDKWLTPQHLNKNMSMKKVEANMTEFLEKVQADIEALNTFEDRTVMIADYLKCFNLPEVFANVRAREEREEQAKRVAEALNEEAEPEEPTAVFVIKGQKDIVAAEALLKANGIEFEKK